MVRRSLIVAALVALASPLAAQEEEFVWTAGRPDSDAPIGVWGARTLDAGALELTYRYTQANSRGAWFAKDSLPLATTLQLYTVAPLELSNITHSVTAAWGMSDRLTLMGTAEFSLMERKQITNAGVLYVTGTESLGDITASALYEVYRGGAYRMNVSAGAVLPVGAARTYACTPFSSPGGCVSGSPEEALPYDQRPGGGAFALTFGSTALVQNESASLGAQFKGRVYVGEGAADFTPGDRFQADGWGAYQINSVFSISGGVRWQTWGALEGADPQLVATRDPGSDAVTGLAGGERVDMPVGLNMVMPEGSVLAGHRLAVEGAYALHHEYEGVRLGFDWGLNFGWTVPF
jgi:hypothetical protein